MTNFLKVRRLGKNNARNAWNKNIIVREFKSNDNYISTIHINNKLISIFNNSYDTWDLIEDGVEFLEQLKIDLIDPDSPIYGNYKNLNDVVISQSILNN